MNGKIIHILDDEKVIDRTIEYFETVFPNGNIFFILKNSSNRNLKYIKNIDQVIICDIDNPTEIFCNLDQAKHIIFHLLDDKKIKILEKINHPNITWMAWGADLYNSLLVHRGYKLYRDRTILKKTGIISKKRKYFPFLTYFIDKYRLKKRIQAIKKINNIAAIDEDYKLLTKYFPEFSHLKRIDFFYYPIDALLGKELIDRKCLGKKIMVGNSSSPNGNHLYALELISKCNNNYDIIIPLSYGDICYRKWVLSKFSQYPNLNISSIQDFIPLNEYISLLLECSNFIYANLRQEALGNILVAFFIGGKVFLDKENPLYIYFNNLNLKFYTLEDINDFNLNTPLSSSDLLHNRNIIKDIFSYEKLLYLIKTNFQI